MLLKLRLVETFVWEYKTPLLAGTPVSQGDTIPLNGNLTFRFYRYSFDYPAFDGRNEDLEPDGYLELNPDSSLCPGDLTGIFHPQALPQIKLFPKSCPGFALYSIRCCAQCGS